MWGSTRPNPLDTSMSFWHPLQREQQTKSNASMINSAYFITLLSQIPIENSMSYKELYSVLKVMLALPSPHPSNLFWTPGPFKVNGDLPQKSTGERHTLLLFQGTQTIWGVVCHHPTIFSPEALLSETVPRWDGTQPATTNLQTHGFSGGHQKYYKLPSNTIGPEIWLAKDVKGCT